MGQAVKIPDGSRVNHDNDDENEMISIGSLEFTRKQIESQDFVEEQGQAIADSLSGDFYYRRYQENNLIRSLAATSEITKKLFNRYSEDPRQDAIMEIEKEAYCDGEVRYGEVRPRLSKIYEEIEEQAEDLEWNFTACPYDFEEEISDIIMERLYDEDDSKLSDLLNSQDYTEVAFIFMDPNKYRDDCLIWHNYDWGNLQIEESFVDVLARLGHGLTAYRQHSGNKNESSCPDFKPKIKTEIPIVSLEDMKEISENVGTAYFHYAIYAQVPLKDLFETDLNREVIIQRYEFCGFSDQGTYHGKTFEKPIIIKPEMGTWYAFEGKGPSEWCGMSNQYYRGKISN